MADFEELKPERFLIDVINFGCDDKVMRETIFKFYHDKGYRDIGAATSFFSHTMYKVVRKLKPGFFSTKSTIFKRICRWLTLNLHMTNH